jgi:Tfp pilus assembly protein PilV
MNHKYSYATGSSILEIMLVIFISSIGIYNIFKISLSSITNINKNNQYLNASYAVQDIANRILANYEIAKNTNAYITSKFSIDSNDCKDSIGITSCQKKLCSPTDIANYDITIWKQLLVCRLNNATAEINAIETGTIKKYEITIEFNSTTNKSNKDEEKIKISTYQVL